METFVLAFILLGLVITGMAFGVLFSGKNLKGSCGGLQMLPGAEKCPVCQKEIISAPPQEAFRCGKS